MAGPDEQTVLHEGTEARMRFKVPEGGSWVSVTVVLERLDTGGVPGTVAVRMEGLDEGRDPRFNIGLNNVLSLRDAGRFADMLRQAIASDGPTEGPEVAARETNPTPEGDHPTLVCIDCGDEVFVWSTPDVDRCWRCDEKADAMAGVLR
jgi:hypothetical protein